eukprot:TRINITY_DN42200_c0_g1_i1.p1 TRINITY_DN42200_c0_g1~~TRINITY_DN42200_c0_g1_i1.p1  ORF type:complete len:404 (+),score=71.63 TRINITY_DN42200_c0_g1_i1:33-1214(+)
MAFTRVVLNRLVSAAAAALFGAVVAVAFSLGRRKRRPRQGLRAPTLPEFPPSLLGSLRSLDAVAILGVGALTLTRETRRPRLAQLLLEAVDLKLAPGAKSAASASPPEAGEGGKPGADRVRRSLARLINEGPTVDTDEEVEAELLLGDACEALGRKNFSVACRSALLKRRRPGGQTSTAACAAAEEVLRRRLAAVAATPFTAVLAAACSDELEQQFPHRVGRNFGGYAAILGKPRVDVPPARARPLLHLWPALGAKPGSDATTPSGHQLPASRAEVEVELSPGNPYPTFLRDLFRTKVAVLVGCQLPPRGHLGAALRDAWKLARAHDAARREPLAYALAPATAAEGGVREICNENFGLCVLSYDSEAWGERGLEHCLLALSSAAASCSSECIG